MTFEADAEHPDATTKEQRYIIAVNNLAGLLWQNGAGGEALRVLGELLTTTTQKTGGNLPCQRSA